MNKQIHTETKHESDTEQHKIGKATLEVVADALRKPGFKHIGSISAHFYVADITHEVQIQVLPIIKGVPEQIAILGSQELNKVLKAAYGHKEPARRK